jgi:predicted RNase H-like HicB family nuclease
MQFNLHIEGRGSHRADAKHPHNHYPDTNPTHKPNPHKQKETILTTQHNSQPNTKPSQKQLSPPPAQTVHKQVLSNTSPMTTTRTTSLKFAVVVEKDEQGYYVASVPELPGCHTQAKTLDKLTKRTKEAIEAYLEAEGHKPKTGSELIGIQFVEVPSK